MKEGRMNVKGGRGKKGVSDIRHMLAERNALQLLGQPPDPSTRAGSVPGFNSMATSLHDNHALSHTHFLFFKFLFIYWMN